MIRFDQVQLLAAPAPADGSSRISLTIAAGENVSVIGANGAGKSTFIRTIAGVHEPISGAVYVAGAQMTRESSHARVVYVGQDPLAHIVGATVADDIAFALECALVVPHEMQPQVSRQLHRFSLAHRADHEPAALSGGEQQRLTLAATTVLGDAAVLLLDEAYAHLDELLQRDMQGVIREIRAQANCTTLTVTHDWQEIRAADRVLGLRGGEVVWDGPPGELLQQPQVLEGLGLGRSAGQKLADALALRGVEQPDVAIGRLIAVGQT